MNYRVVEVPHHRYVNICIQVKKWYGWVTFKIFETEYDDKDEYEYCVSEANGIIELLNKRIIKCYTNYR